MNQVAQLKSNAMNTAIEGWFREHPAMAMRGIDEPTWLALCNSVYPGASSESILMAVDYCQARGLDVMLKPVHLVPMSVKTGQKDGSGKDIYANRDVAMPGIGLYRIQASRAGDYAGAEEPEFGPEVTKTFRHEYSGKVTEKTITYPAWCKYTVAKLIGDRIVKFSAKEFWLENYATQSRFSELPNAMWEKRPYGQLAKCAEAQALRRAWPDIGQEPTAEEMQGKGFDDLRDITPPKEGDAPQEPEIKQLPVYPQEKFDAKLSNWVDQIDSGSRTADDVIATLSSRYQLTGEQINTLKNTGAPA